LTYEYSYVFFDSSSNPASRSTVVQTKTASDVGTWTFSYTPGSYGVYDATSVSGPEGTVIYHHVGPNYAQLGSVWQIGLLMSKTLGTVQSEVYTWGKIKISNQINMRPGAFSVKTDPEVDVPFLSTKITVRDGATYSLAVNAYDNWGKPTHTTESGSGGGKRVTNLGYYSDGTLWIVDEPQSQVVTNGLSVSKSFDATGNIASVVKDGVLTSYTRFPTGDIKQATFPRTLVHNYSNYKRGQAQTEVQPEGINITRVIDDVGNMTSYTNGELHTTSYAYDGLNRIKAITYPIGNAVAITYTSTTKSAVRGGLTEATSYDGFGRVTSITLGGVATTYKYDSAGRLTFASNPGDSVGTTYGNFDVLGRYHSVSNADATSRSINYGSGTKTVVNERTKSTTDSFLGYSDPDEVYVTAVAAAEPTANVTIGRDAWNRVHTITQAGLTRTYGFNSNGYLISVDNPEASFTYGRDAAGNMTQRVDNGGAGSGATYTYDNQNRLSGESYSGWLPVRATIRTYTRTNKLKTVNASGQWASNMVYGYDSNDNLHTKAVTVDSQTFTTTIGYNTNDQVAYLSYPYSSTVVSYAPDVLGRPTSVSSFVKSVAYWPSGQIKTLTYGNQTISSYGQNNRLWPSNFSTVMGSTRYANSAYVYDGVGNLNSITDSIDASYSRTLGYDNIDRLITASGPWGTGAITYDGAGNIKSQNLGSYGLTYTYDSHGMLTTLAGSRASSFVYDWNGNVTSAYGNTYAYDEVPNLSCVNCSGGTSGTQYGYDGNNKRLDIFKAGVLTYELYGPHDTLLVEYTPSTGASIEYFYLGNKRVAQRVNSGPSASQTIVGTAPVGTVAMSIPVSAAVVGTAAPTGSVDFFEGANLLGTAKVAASSGFATTTVRFSSAGSHTISATYRGDSLNKTSTSTLNATVAVSAQTVVDARPNPSGAHYYFTASTSVGSKSPTGIVSFYNNGALVGTAAPNTATGIAAIYGYTDGSGYDSITAIYPGDANNPGVTSIPTRLNETSDNYYVIANSYPFNVTAVAGQPFRLYEICKPSLPQNYPFVPLPSQYGQAFVYDGTTSLGGGTYDQNLGATSFNITLTTVGTHNLEIDCGGSGPYLPTANSQTVTVTQ
jgi:YD repeat-containing protein